MENYGLTSTGRAAPSDAAGCRAILDALGDAVLIHDAENGEIREVNRKMCDLFGYSPEEARGLNVGELVRDGHLPPEMASGAPGQATGLREWQVKDRSGRQFWVEAQLNRTVFAGREQVCAVLRDISSRKQAEAERQESESIYRLVTEGSLAGGYLVQEGRFIYVNPCMAETFGYTAEEIMSGRVAPTDLVHPDDLAMVRENLRRRFAGEVQSLHYTFRGRRRDGAEIYCEVLGNAVEYRGEPAVVGTLVDITTRKCAEEALQAQRNLLDTVFSATPDFLFLKDQDSVYRALNQALCRYLGKSAEEVVGKTDFDLFPPDEAERNRRDDAQVLQTGLPLIRDEEVTGAADKKWLQVVKVPMVDETGKPTGVLGSVRDISERKEMEKALQASEANYRAIFNAVNDGIAVVDLETGNFLDVNERWCQMTGYSAAEARGLNVAALCVDEPSFSAAEAMRWITEASKEGPQLFEFMAQTKEGRRHWVEINLRRTVIGGQERLLAVVRDISERKRTEEALRISEENYRTIFDSANDGITVEEIATGRFLDVNQKFLEMTGYTREEAKKLTFETFCTETPPFTNKEAWNWHRKVIEEGPQTFEWTKDRIHWVGLYMKCTVIGGKECILTNIRDITERKRAEEALRTSEAKYRNLVEQIPAITYIAALDNVSSPLYISPQVEAILGYTPEEFIADPEMFKKQIHPEDRDRVLTDLLLSYAEGGPFAAEYRMLSKTGRVVWLRDESRAVYDSEGQPLFMQGVALDITKRRKVEEALREVNNKLSALVQASPLAIVALDLQGRVTSWNPAAERIFGWRWNEVVGRPHPIIPEGKKGEYKQLWQRLLQGEPLLGLDLRRRKKDGSLIDVSLFAAPLYDAAGRPAGAIGIFADITARKRTEEALRESEARFRTIFEGAPIGIYLEDLKSGIPVMNPALLEMGGYSAEENLRFEGADVTHPDDWEADSVLFAEMVAGKRNRFQKETRYRHKQGHWIWVRLSVSLVRDAAGLPHFVICMVEDITQRKQAENAAEEIRRQQEAILSNIPDLAWLKDRESRFIAVNEPFGQACGVPPQQLVGKTDLDIWPRDLALRYRADDREVMRTGNRKQVEEPMMGGEGNIVWIETIKTPIFNERQEVVGTAGIARDITERRRMEEALRKVSRALMAVTECDQAMLRASSEAELLSEVCRIIVEVGGYRMAWVGFARQDEERSVQPMAQEGFDEGYMQTLRVSWADVDIGRGPVGAAIRTGKPAITRDTQSDPRFAPWRKEALKRGFASVLALPLEDTQTFGALAIYASEPNAFDDEEINLLFGLANDLAYGIKALRAGSERRRAEEALRESEKKYRSLMDGASDAIVLADTQGMITEMNQRAQDLLGYPEEELLGMHHTQIHPAQIIDHVMENFNGILTTGSGPLHECKVLRKDGQVVPVDITHIMVESGDNKVIQAVIRDVTERQRADEALRDSEQKLRLLASQLLTVQEKERHRVARELHDELGQDLTVLKIHLVAIENKLHPDQQELKASCERLLGYIDEVIENVRRLSWDLSPSILEDLGLSSSLKYLIQEICRNNNMLYSVAVDEIDNLFSPEVKINIYRIFQESLTNIVRHANASHIDVKITKQDDRVSFLLKDDGKGLDLKKARSRNPAKRGLGLTTINERALMTGGTLSIWSRKDKGTSITLTIPIQK